MENIISGSKLIAEYMNLVYLPFSVELKEKGMKAGWYETKQRTFERNPTIEIDGEIKEVKIDFERIMNTKNGWKLFENKYYKFVCRHHGGLRFYNSWDSLISVIEKIEKENGFKFLLYNNGAQITTMEIHSFDIELTWIQNTFNAVVKYLENGRISRN